MIYIAWFMPSQQTMFCSSTLCHSSAFSLPLLSVTPLVGGAWIEGHSGMTLSAAPLLWPPVSGWSSDWWLLWPVLLNDLIRPRAMIADVLGRSTIPTSPPLRWRQMNRSILYRLRLNLLGTPWETHLLFFLHYYRRPLLVEVFCAWWSSPCFDLHRVDYGNAVYIDLS